MERKGGREVEQVSHGKKWDMEKRIGGWKNVVENVMLFSKILK